MSLRGCFEQGSAGSGSCERGLCVGSETGGFGGGGARPLVTLPHKALVLQSWKADKHCVVLCAVCSAGATAEWMFAWLGCCWTASAFINVHLLIDGMGVWFAVFVEGVILIPQ